MKLRLFIDRSSVEAFGDGGRFAMTNQVFPSEPYLLCNGKPYRKQHRKATKKRNRYQKVIICA